jgi:hypothetical protein
MAQNINRDFAHVRCLNNSGCIFVDNSHLKEACLSFCEKVERQLNNKEGRNIRQQKYKGVPEIEKAEDGFMIGAAKASYYIKNPNTTFDELPVKDHCIAVSGNFIVEPGNHLNQWLTAPPNFAPRGFDFIAPESGITSRLEDFHTVYFKKPGSAADRTKIHTIYGMPFSDFYKTNIRVNQKHPHIYRDYNNRDLPNYRGIVKKNISCAAQQLIVYVGDRVSELKKAEGKNIIPVIEICELWAPSRQGQPIDRKWPQFSSSCPCKTCKIVLPYLITPDSGLSSVVGDLYASLREKYAKKKK